METYYKGRLMRSQLEARWAAFFDQVGWEYDYEPALDLNGWIPDFILYTSDYVDDDGNEKQHKILVEVKPFSTKSAFKECLEKINSAVKGTGWEDREVLLLGSSVFKSREYVVDENEPYALLGWLYQTHFKHELDENKKVVEKVSKIICEAYPIELNLTQKIEYDLSDSDMFSRFNGYWDHNYGSSYCFDWASHMTYANLKKLWDLAGNEVQWRKTFVTV